MSDTINPSLDYSTLDETTTPELKQLTRYKDELTRQRDKLAKAIRIYTAAQESGQHSDVDPWRELQTSQDALRKIQPDIARVAPESGVQIDVSVNDLLAVYWDQVKQRKNTASTGFKKLNDILSGGIEPSRLVCVLGAPNTGKTTFVHQMADSIACSGRPVLYVTSEDTPSALLAKTLARIGGVNYNAVLKGWETERDNINKAIATQRDRASSDRLRYLDATNGITMEMIREKAQEHFARFNEQNGGGPGVIVVDYLQRIAKAVKSMSGFSQETREVVSLVADRLRGIACELGCGVIAIASQNRQGYSRGSDSSSIASAKESGDIEYTADVLMALVEDKDKNRVAPQNMTPILLYVDKNRQGEKNRFVALDFWGARQQFTEASSEE